MKRYSALVTRRDEVDVMVRDLIEVMTGETDVVVDVRVEDVG